MLLEAISDENTKLMVYNGKGPSQARCALEQFKSIAASLELALDQPIPEMLVYARFLDALGGQRVKVIPHVCTCVMKSFLNTSQFFS